MTKPQAVRKRAYKPKVRTGCVTCKARRIKCDETKPQCNACVYIGTQCCYQRTPPPQNRDAPRALLPANYSAEALAELPLCTSPRSAFADLASRDVTYLEYFVRKVVKQLSFSRIGDSALAAFWSRTVLRQCEQDQHILDAVLSIGALARARGSGSTRAPLFQHRLSGSLQNEHYYEALQHYTRAVSRTRKILNDTPSEAKPRAMLVTCLLFIMFELLQDNARAVDDLTASAIQLLQRPASTASTTVFDSLATFIDDEGISEAEYFVLTSSMNNSVFSPMYPNARDRLQDLTSAGEFKVPEIVGPDKSLKEFLAVWWNFVIVSLSYSFRFATTGKTAGFILPYNSPQEAATMRARLESWMSEVRRRKIYATSPYTAYLLQTVEIGIDVMIRGSQTAPGSMTDSPYLFLGMPDQNQRVLLDLFRVSKEKQVGPVGVPLENELELVNEGAQDAAIPSLLFIARGCPCQSMRYEALDLCRTVVRPHSSWSLKAIWLGMRAIVDVEGEYQTPDGNVPPSAHWAWTDGHWNDDYTGLHVTLTATHQTEGDTPQVRHLVLSPQEYGLA